MFKNKILKYPNNHLIKPTIPWDFSVGSKMELLFIISKMEELLKSRIEGVALAANQAGYKHRMFVLTEKFAKDYSLPTAIINPVITTVGSRTIEEKEGCLSFPGLFFDIKRQDLISCDFYDVDGNKRAVLLEDFSSRVFQHECEHLDGKLFIENLPKRERYQIFGKLKNGAY